MPKEKAIVDNLTMNKTLQKVFKSTFFVALGTLLGSTLLFFAKILIIRNWSQSNFGVFTLAITIPAILLIIFSLGLKDGITRNLAFFRGKYQYNKINEIISSSIIYFFLSGIIASIILFFTADFISIKIFNTPDLVKPLKIIATLLPFSKLLSYFGSIFRGYDQVEPQIFFNEILKYFLLFAFVSLIVIFDLPFITIFYLYLIAIIISCVLMTIYAFKKLPVLKNLSLKYIKKNTMIELIIFSLPLLGSSLIFLFMKYINTLMLGSIKGVISVALYEAAVPIAAVISMPLTALSLIYMPVISGLFAKRKYTEIRRNYTILTKWIIWITFPIFIVFIFYSDELITFLFGDEYISASNIFRITAIAYIIMNFLGLNSHSLIVIGKTRIILFSILLGAVINIGLNILLVPSYGVNGAGIGFLISIFISNFLMSLILYKHIKAHPFSFNLGKSILCFSILMIFLYFVTINITEINIFLIFGVYFLCYFVLLFSIIITKSGDEEDINAFDTFEKITGLKLKRIRELFLKSI